MSLIFNCISTQKFYYCLYNRTGYFLIKLSKTCHAEYLGTLDRHQFRDSTRLAGHCLPCQLRIYYLRNSTTLCIGRQQSTNVNSEHEITRKCIVLRIHYGKIRRGSVWVQSKVYQPTRNFLRRRMDSSDRQQRAFYYLAVCIQNCNDGDRESCNQLFTQTSVTGWYGLSTLWLCN